MKKNPYLSGFTFIKNGLTLGYPIKESIESIAHLCDEVIINVGFDNPLLVNDDGTYDYLRTHFNDPKFFFLKSHWDPELMQKGLVLSQQTNIALNKCQGKFCLYIQGDEVIHEDDIQEISNGLRMMDDNPQLEGLVFNYLHFYWNVDIIKHTRNTYRREVRLIRNHQNLTSWLDAQGFRHPDGTKVKALLTKARVFHYGWARKIPTMKKKISAMDKLYHGLTRPESGQDFQYQKIWGLKKFAGTHPRLMKEWIEKNRNEGDILSLNYKFSLRDLGLMISDMIESLTDYRLGEYKNYSLGKTLMRERISFK